MTLIRVRRGTSASWATANPILAAGEPGFDSSLRRLKVGDGTSTWSVLPFLDQNNVGTVASSATPAINVAYLDQFNITALAVNITSMTSGLSGTPVDGQRLVIRFKDNGTARTIAWGASFVAAGASLLTTTVATKTHVTEFIYDATASKWGCIRSDSTGY